jgi:hypothetical protein
MRLARLLFFSASGLIAAQLLEQTRLPSSYVAFSLAQRNFRMRLPAAGDTK